MSLRVIAVGWAQAIGAKWQARRRASPGQAPPDAIITETLSAAQAIVQQGFTQRLTWVDISTPGSPGVWEGRLIEYFTTNAWWVTTIGTQGNPGALRGVTGVNNGDVVFVAGFWTIGDGGGGQFSWDAGSSAPDDGGIIIQPTGVTLGRWRRIEETDRGSTMASVKWFGAKGDNATDDSAAIEACILACDAIYFPNGRYVVSQSFDVTGKHIEGELRVASNALQDSVEIKLNAVPAIDVFFSATGPVRMINLDIRCQNTANHAISILNGSGPATYLSRLMLSETLSHAVVLDTCQDIDVIGLFAKTCAGAGFVLNDCDNARFANCRALYCDDYGFIVGAFAGSGQATFESCIVEAQGGGGGGGWYILETTKPVQILNSWIEFETTETQDGIVCEDATGGGFIHGMRISQGGAATGFRSVKLLGTSANWVVSDNNCINDVSVLGPHIELAADARYNVICNNLRLGSGYDSNVVVNNSTYPNEIQSFFRTQRATVPAPTTAAGRLMDQIANTAPTDGGVANWIYARSVAHASGEWMIFDHPHPDPSSITNDASPYVDTSHTFKVTGAATIATLQGGYEGKRIVFVAVGNVTIKHTTGVGENISLSGSVDFNMVAGNTLTLVRITNAAFTPNTVWIEVDRMV